MKHTTMTFTVALTILLAAGAANTARAESSSDAGKEGFLSDYSKLQPVKGDEHEKTWVVADAEKRASKYTSIMIDQPEMFVSPDSKYKGVKPDDLKALADELRDRFREEFEKSGKYKVVEKPGANVVYLHIAISDLKLQKKKRPVLAYTPVGAVVHGARKLAKDMTEKIDLKYASIEVEVMDSVTNEPLGAYVLSRSSDKDLSWDELRLRVQRRGQTCRVPTGEREGPRGSKEELPIHPALDAQEV